MVRCLLPPCRYGCTYIRRHLHTHTYIPTHKLVNTNSITYHTHLHSHKHPGPTAHQCPIRHRKPNRHSCRPFVSPCIWKLSVFPTYGPLTFTTYACVWPTAYQYTQPILYTAAYQYTQYTNTLTSARAAPCRPSDIITRAFAYIHC